MLSTLTVVLPIFALILSGWLTRRLNVLGPHATAELNRFVVYLALPALLFDLTAHARWIDVWRPGFVATFGLGTAVVFLLTLALRLRRPLNLADAAIDGLNAGYGNTGFVGFPLVVMALGREALGPTLVAMLITVCILFAVAIALIETGLRTEKGRRRIATKVGLSLIKNPLIIAPILGAIVPITGLAVPAGMETFLKLLGAAASPCALIALGLFMAAPAGGRAAECPIGGAPRRVQAQAPARRHLGARDRRVRPSAVPHARGRAPRGAADGDRPFMLAEFYRREADVTSSVVLASTVASIFTIAGYLTVAT